MNGGSIDTVHGYAYYGTYDSDTNVPGKIYKLKLGDGDVPPTSVGTISLHPGEGRLSASVVDPAGGYVYFADDNSYPGGVYQLALNGTNLPIEMACLQLQGGTERPRPAAPPPKPTTRARSYPGKQWPITRSTPASGRRRSTFSGRPAASLTRNPLFARSPSCASGRSRCARRSALKPICERWTSSF